MQFASSTSVETSVLAPRAFSESVAKSFKRRATTACSWCQFRKIRCNVEESNPCSNCTIEKIECTITKRRRTKKDRPSEADLDVTPVQSQRLIADIATIFEGGRGLQQLDAPQNSLQHAIPIGNVSHQSSVPPNNNPANNVGLLLPTENDRESTSALNPTTSLSTNYAQKPALSSPPSFHSVFSPSTVSESPSKRSCSSRPTLPEYLEPIPEHLSSDDLEYLQKKGCLEIPSEKFRNALICGYGEWSHPYYPMVLLDEFLSSIANPTPSSNKLSLLVFQAVLFAGSAHCDIKPLRMMGFMTRKAARRALFERTKVSYTSRLDSIPYSKWQQFLALVEEALANAAPSFDYCVDALYQFGYEQNRINVIQALILMSLWYSTPDDQMDAFHWLSIAVSLARRASLHRNPALMDMPERERRMRKRIWWCCVIRDPLLALGLKRPIIISPADHDVPELTLDDFDVFDLEKSQAGLAKLGVPWNHPRIRLLRLTCISQAKLHQILSQIMSKQYVLGDHHRGNRPISQSTTRAVLLPSTTDGAWQSLRECEERLRKWREDLPEELISTTMSHDSSDTTFDVSNVFRIVVHMIYHTCWITMYRPWLQPFGEPYNTSTGPNDPVFQSKIQTAIRASAYSVTNFAVELHKADLARHLSQTGLSALIAAAVSHISDIASGDESLKEPATQGLDKCSHMLNELRENYYSADFAFEFISLLARANNPTKGITAQVAQSTQSHSLEFDEQSMAQQGFLAAAKTPTTSATNMSAVLPTALFPSDTGLSTSVLIEHDLPSLDFGDSTISLALEDQQILPMDESLNWDYYDHFREESSRLLGDFLGDYNFSGFNSLPAIDIGT